MNALEIFKTMSAVMNSFPNEVSAAELIWVNEQMDFVATNEQKLTWSEDNVDNARKLEIHSIPMIALRLREPDVEALAVIPTRDEALEAVKTLEQWLHRGCPGGPWRGLEPLTTLYKHLGKE